MTLHRPSPDRRPRRFPHPPRWSPLFPQAVPLLCLSTLAALTPWTAPSLAQTIVADTTLQQPTIVQQSGSPRLWTITGGTPNQAGNLLFHSFLFFTLGSGETVLFNNSPQANNIFARVTGTVASSLPGTLRTSNPANLFLLNPNGISMNGQTRLDIGGSFFASTGDRLIFADSSFFSARSPNPAPLLVVNPPTALWMGNNPGSITIGGGTHGLSFNADFSVNRQFQATGVTVAPGQFIGLIGNGVTFNGSYLRASQGTIEVASLASGTVQLKTPSTDSPWHFSYDEANSRFSAITLNSRTALDVSGPGGGDLSLQGSQITVNAGSTLLADTLGSQSGGLLRVRGTESVTVAGVGGTSPRVFASSLFAAVNPGASGHGGTLEVITPFFRTANGAVIGVDTFGSGNAGTFRVQGGVVEVDRADWSVQSFGASTGRGGEIDLNIDTLRVLNGGQILAQSLGQGSAGRVFIEAKDSVTIQGERLSRNNVLNSVITAFQSERSRGAGQVEIQTGSLILQDGGRISMTSRSTNASLGQGSLIITARDFVEVTGTSSNGAPSLITTTAEGSIKGDNITITTPYLTARQGGQISSGTVGEGRGGDLQLTVENTLTLEGRSAVIPGNNLGNLPVFKDSSGIWFPSGLLAGSRGPGAAGTLAVQAKTIVLRDRAEMTVSGESSGNAGNLVIQDSDLIQLQGESKIRGDTRAGSGNIQVYGDRLELTENSSITTNALSQTLESGNITVEVGSLNLDRSFIASDSAGGLAGNVSITATQSQGLRLNHSRISANGGLGNVSIEAPLITLQNQSLVSTNGQGILNTSGNPNASSGDGGNILLQSGGMLRLSDSDITANAQNSNGGSIRLEIPSIYLDQASAITTNVSGTAVNPTLAAATIGGDITIQAQTLRLDRASEITSNATIGAAGNVNLSDLDPNNPLTLVLENSRITATGGSGNLNLSSRGTVSLLNQSRLSTDGQGNQGGGQIALIARSLLASTSAVTANAQNSNGGSIRLEIPDITLDQASSITTNVAGTAGSSASVTGTSGGDISIQARTLRLDRASEITSNATVGAAGNINLGDLDPNNPLALVLDNSRITATGGSGNLNLSSRGTVSLFNQSRLSTDGQGSQGGGRIALVASRLLADASTLSANALGQGSDSGQVNLLLGSLVLQNNSAITSDAPAGAAGDVILTLGGEGLFLDHSRITATGGSGNLQIQTPNLLLQNASLLSTNGQGDLSGGSILATVGQQLHLLDSNITANADNSFGGQVNLSAPLIRLDRSTITTNILGTEVSPEITGGNITLTGGSIYLYDRSQIASNATTGGAGNISLTATAPNTIRLRNSQITATGGLGNLSLRSVGNIELLEGSLISTNGQGSQPGGNITIDTDRFLIGLQNSDITANAENSAGGRVLIRTAGLIGLQLRDALTSQSDITVTSALGPDFSGVVALDTPDSQVDSGLAELPEAPADPSDQVIAACPAAQGNRFSVLGPGGIPENPLAPLRPAAGWQDLQNALLLSPESQPTSQAPLSPAPQPLLTEANTWHTDSQGRVHLLAQSPQGLPKLLSAACR